MRTKCPLDFIVYDEHFILLAKFLPNGGIWYYCLTNVCRKAWKACPFVLFLRVVFHFFNFWIVSSFGFFESWFRYTPCFTRPVFTGAPVHGWLPTLPTSGTDEYRAALGGRKGWKVRRKRSFSFFDFESAVNEKCFLRKVFFHSLRKSSLTLVSRQTLRIVLFRSAMMQLQFYANDQTTIHDYFCEKKL